MHSFRKAADAMCAICGGLRSRGSVALVLAAACATATPAIAAKFHILHNFSGGLDGAAPGYTLAMDGKGRLVGAANSGGQDGTGTVFRLAQKNGNWHFSVLYNFTGDEGQPGWGVTLGQHGTLFTNAGYASVMGGPCGSALELTRAPAHKGLGSLSGTLIHTYTKDEDGCPTGNLLLDSGGNLYGVTQDGGANGWGSIFELSPSDSGWNQTILYSFRGADDGGAPYSGLIVDSAGNLYGTATASSGANFGTVFEISPAQGGWTYNVLYTFTGRDDGGQPVAGLTFDGAGNLFGATAGWGAKGGGTIFELSPSGGSWSFSVLHSLTGSDGPVTSLTMDSAGTLYGTNFMDGTYGYGSVFRLAPAAGKWSYKDLHDFTGGRDGGYPGGSVVLDANGNLYGTAFLGGKDSWGLVYQITP